MTIANNSFSLNSFKITSGSVTFGPGTWSPGSANWLDTLGYTNSYISVPFYDAVSSADPENSLFTSAPLVIVSLGDLPAYSNYMVARAKSVTSSGFNAYIYNLSTDYAPPGSTKMTITLNWIAIGT
jgi:hypothetical protein